ncbi:MAG: DUF4876 domain-containing protein [Chitinophagaceae bacterium]|nr:DUF4876 domain-containing protein [Chitinophagaceae bacterium]
MQRIKLTYIAVALLLLAACRKEYRDVPLIGAPLATVYPQHFNKHEAGNVSLTITNKNTGEQFKIVSDANGRVVVPDMISGNYIVEAFKMVSAEEALELTGVNIPFPVNATKLVTIKNGMAEEEIPVNGTNPQPLVFKEIYYTGSRTPANGTYFSDQFYEIYNNTDQIIYADSLCIANTGGNAGNVPTARTWGFKPDQDYVYLQNVWMIPGNGTEHPIQPGQSIIIAQDGINHKTDPLGNSNSPVNLGLGVADWESYVPRADNRDLDADVPNLEAIYLGSVGFDWLTGVFGPGMVIFKHKEVKNLPLVTEPGNTSTAQYMQLPVKYVYDAVDCLANPTAISFKRIPNALDAGFKSCSGSYVSESLRRKVARTENGRRILQDLNNSSIDFETVKPPLVRW